jgi:hypothetical protein
MPSFLVLKPECLSVADSVLGVAGDLGLLNDGRFLAAPFKFGLDIIISSSEISAE